MGRKAGKGSFRRPDGERHRARAKGGRGPEVSFTDDENRFEICVREDTRVRVPDARCDDEDEGFAWYYVRLDGRAPATGRRASGGSFLEPSRSTYRAEKRGGSGMKAAIDPYADTDMDTDSSTGTGTGSGDSSTRSQSGCGLNCGGGTRTKSGRR
nr:hypothetical protein GCM10020093_056330 [Planobispora longispora]